MEHPEYTGGHKAFGDLAADKSGDAYRTEDYRPSGRWHSIIGTPFRPRTTIRIAIRSP